MTDASWGLVFVLGLAALVALLFMVMIWQVFRTKQAKISTRIDGAQEAAYRELAVRATETQERAIAELSELRDRVNELERTLKEAG